MKSNSDLLVYLSANRFDNVETLHYNFERETTKYMSIILYIKALS